MEAAEDVVKAIEFCDHMANPETELSWISPADHDSSRDYLTAAPAEYADIPVADPDLAAAYDLPQIDDASTDPAPYRILDAGCGGAQLATSVAQAYPSAHVQGIDLAPKYGMAAAAKYREETGNDNLTVLGGDLTAVLPELGNPFDHVYAVNVIQTASRPEHMVDQIYDALTEDGSAIATLPGDSASDLFSSEYQHTDADTGRPYMDVSYPSFDVRFDMHLFPDNTGESLFEDAGFEVEQRTITASKDGLSAILEQSNMSLPDDTSIKDIEPTVDLYILEK